MPLNASAPDMQASSPFAAYRARVENGALAEDAAQESVARRLQQLHDELAAFGEQKRGLLAKLKAPQAPRSLYIWGAVGRGKSMLMDLFFETAPVQARRRIHFHAFMQEVHARIHEFRKQKSGDPVAMLVGEMAREAELLCFDELQATDVADASLIFRLFEGLFAQGVVVVATSNRKAEDIYTGGVQRERFDAAIGLFKENMDSLSLTSETDYRREQAVSVEKTYHFPLGPAAERFVRSARERLTHTAPRETLELEVHGRKLEIAAYRAGGKLIAQASFEELCAATLGAADYLALAAKADALILTSVPRLSAEKRNEAKRFVTLVDALYEAHRLLIITADAAPDQLYPAGDGSFEFHRTASRLHEMMGERYSGGWAIAPTL